jgi:hypothetical protein
MPKKARAAASTSAEEWETALDSPISPDTGDEAHVSAANLAAMQEDQDADMALWEALAPEAGDSGDEAQDADRDLWDALAPDSGDEAHNDSNVPEVSADEVATGTPHHRLGDTRGAIIRSAAAISERPLPDADALTGGHAEGVGGAMAVAQAAVIRGVEAGAADIIERPEFVFNGNFYVSLPASVASRMRHVQRSNRDAAVLLGFDRPEATLELQPGYLEIQTNSNPDARLYSRSRWCRRALMYLSDSFYLRMVVAQWKLNTVAFRVELIVGRFYRFGWNHEVPPEE